MKKKKYIPDYSDIPSERKRMQSLSLEERRLNFNRVELGYTREEAQAEARRCLSCRQCIGCALCMAECKERAIILKQKPEKLDIEIDSIILAPGFEPFDPGRKPELGYNRFYNIVSSVELERMLDPNGPFSGLVLRPWDGVIPTKIAFIQCVGSREEFIGANYCSSVCCSQAIKQALQLQEKDGKTELKIFYRDDIRPLGKGSEESFKEAMEKPKIKFIRAKISNIEEDEETKDIILDYKRDGKTEKEAFNLLVLSIGLWAPITASKLKNLTGIKLNKYKFCSTNTFCPQTSSQAAIFACGTFTKPMNLRDSIAQASAAAGQALTFLAQRDELAFSSEDVQQNCLIIGSGPAGLSAAQTVSGLGFQAFLVERDAELGGGLRSRYSTLAEENLHEGLVKLIDTVNENGKVQIYTNANVVSLNESNDLFKVEIAQKNKKIELKAGALIVATGAEDYRPEEYHYGSNEKVITQSQLAQILQKEELTASNFAMIQCVGCRNAQRPYCSRICCTEALENALKIKQLNPEAKISILHKGIRIYDFEEELFAESQEKGVEFIKLLEKPHLKVQDGLKLQIREIGRKTIFLSPDLLVLSNAIIPDKNNEHLASILQIPLSDQGFFHPVDEILKPLEAPRPGIYFCGLALWPAALRECISQGSGAAIKACQRLSQLSTAK